MIVLKQLQITFGHLSIRKVLCFLPLLSALSCAVHPDIALKTPVERMFEGRHGDLTPKEMELAKVAWKYFENNYQPATGFVNAVDKYPSTTMWDIASSLGALVSAHELGLIDKNVFDTRLATLLKTFNTMSFFQNELPNKVYHAQTAEKVNYTNKPGEIGYSALDLGRLLIWLKIIKERYPQHGNAIDTFVLRWNFCNVLDTEGTMFGAAVIEGGKPKYLQEGRLGYEEYSAKGFDLWGFNTAKASLLEPFDVIRIYDVDVAYDRRDPRMLGAHNYVVSESYILDAIEFNWDQPSDTNTSLSRHSDAPLAEMAQRIYQVQAERYRRTGKLTARTEHQLDGPPYFVYDAIYTSGYPWNTITESGKYSPEFAAVALKAAVGLWVVWKTDYTDLLFDAVAGMYDPKLGFYEGIYESGKGVIKTFTANNNGIILECLLFKQQGKLLRFGHTESLWDKTVSDQFRTDNCRRERQEQHGQ